MNKKSYTDEFKAHAVAKVLARPSGEDINEMAARLQLSPGTLKGWIQAATRAQKHWSPSPMRAAAFSLADRLLALHETHGMNEKALLGWCRQRGVFARDLAHWGRHSGRQAGARRASKRRWRCASYASPRYSCSAK